VALRLPVSARLRNIQYLITADRFLEKLYAFPINELIGDFLNDCATYNTAYDLDTEELGHYIRDNIQHTAFCGVCKRCSFIYIADAEY
jgi:hypothetical protein